MFPLNRRRSAIVHDRLSCESQTDLLSFAGKARKSSGAECERAVEELKGCL